MRLWFITVGEPLPEIDVGDRYLRTGMVTRMAASRGHDVTWWTSTFDHARKRQRAERDTDVRAAGVHIRMLHGPGYKRNVSLARLRDHAAVGRAFSRVAPSQQQPDLIVCSMPTIELSIAAVEYARVRAIPVVLDVRDMWPDIFVEALPPWARRPGRVLTSWYFAALRRACSIATALIGITDAFLDWSLRYAGRVRGANDRIFPLAYAHAPPPPEDIARAEAYWSGLGIGGADDFTVCYFGAIGKHFEGETVVEAARALSRAGSRVRFVICGTGDALERTRARAVGLDNITFTGWVGAAEIWALMRRSAVGLAPLVSAGGFTMSFPNKSIEYLSAGLPVVSSLQGSLARLLAETECGITYPNGDAAALARTLARLAAHPDRVRTLSQRAIAVYRREFVADTVYSAMLDHLEGMARRAGSQAG